MKYDIKVYNEGERETIRDLVYHQMVAITLVFLREGIVFKIIERSIEHGNR